MISRRAAVVRFVAVSALMAGWLVFLAVMAFRY
jgi:hypothetical protein